jgi:mono/diheme cytochrome c family protein/DNA-binding beta-propeller fold protein YncE
MQPPRSRIAALPLAVLWLASAPAAAEGDASAIYQTHCAACHGADRLGGAGPALLPENLQRLRQPDAAKVIADGRLATQMPAFSAQLDAEEIAALVDLIYRPLPDVPRWGTEEIEASRVVPPPPRDPVTAPVFTADPLNLFVVVEAGDHHVTILDGDRFEPLARFQSRFALHGGPKFSPDGRFVYFASRDGWITKHDLYGLAVVAEARAGINTRNLAISDDGRVLAVANYLPHSVVILDAETLRPLKVIDATDARGTASSRVSAVYQAAPRRSFVVALKDLPELWEISYAPDPPAIFTGFVHSYEQGMVEALPRSQEAFPIRRIALSQPLDDFFFTPDYDALIGSSRDGNNAVVVHLDVRREIAELPLPGLPHLGSGITWMRNGRRVMATPNIKEGRVSIIDMETWSLTADIETLGPGFFMRSHENTRYSWVDTSLGAGRDAIQLIDKQTLKVAHTLRPAPGKTANHVEFTRDGRYALVSVSEMDGGLVVYDAETLQEVKRLPMVKPVGKYNVYNKINRSEGTSH